MNWSTSRASTSLTCSIRAILIAMAIKEVLLYYHARKNFGGGKLANLADCELFAKIFLTNIHRYTKNVFGIICTYLPKFS